MSLGLDLAVGRLWISTDVSMDPCGAKNVENHGATLHASFLQLLYATKVSSRFLIHEGRKSTLMTYLAHELRTHQVEVVELVIDIDAGIDVVLADINASTKLLLFVINGLSA